MEAAIKGALARFDLLDSVRSGVIPSRSERLANVLNSSIFFGLAVLIVMTSVPYGTVEPGWEAIFECTAFALGIVWVIEGLLRKAWTWTGLPLLAPLICIVGLAFFQTLPLWGQSPIRTDPYDTK